MSCLVCTYDTLAGIYEEQSLHVAASPAVAKRDYVNAITSALIKDAKCEYMFKDFELHWIGEFDIFEGVSNNVAETSKLICTGTQAIAAAKSQIEGLM